MAGWFVVEALGKKKLQDVLKHHECGCEEKEDASQTTAGEKGNQEKAGCQEVQPPALLEKRPGRSMTRVASLPRRCVAKHLDKDKNVAKRTWPTDAFIA